VLALVASVLLGWPASAQNGAPPVPPALGFGDENIAVELFAEGAPAEGREWMLALRFTPKGREWHGYWSNPGDAGAGMLLALDLPPDWEVGEARYPVPGRLLISGLMNHIYEGPYVVLVPVVPGPSVKSFAGPVKGTVDYLACTDEICVPQAARLSAKAGGDFARWRAEVAPLTSGDARRLAKHLEPGPERCHLFRRRLKLVPQVACLGVYRKRSLALLRAFRQIEERRVQGANLWRHVGA
jgi:DsbC/DsbD-like thiol-disulfide interchange protein